ncbi:hypothetical protein A2291_03295 [candidate division WOR-1 bacterium RIFOXYB2_FULL_42_35]|uniref:Orotidine 5'-phosphate decarboxylase domain-containing protein n=1 Tax=candidate division WOR-1 bacterium RIFOXYC2_FULL_41_25 TaxID=1802586 RepID=A0A1F4TS65_UNCSA|nr:MAG: hypothetical protein A2247_02570 [candidate division WOR-1 bacterium RIFOXYA2_FULL_41_14]OGC25766.1 MAG: hypothetical protein A2291_03295 [candidate division WOR-1 bacterium RIFOXYB2_FULL_42_35]OGC35400.1 MAG: hypothetical protein A2462_02525 [candidate division WOR-1 bacterium RIFOXYC2_FULL_41_25]
MTRINKLLSDNKLTLIIALPKNDLELAEAAVRGGADALQFHVNITGFAGFAEEKENLQALVRQIKVPLGLSFGYNAETSEAEIKEIKKLGFDFFSVRMKLLPDYLRKIRGIGRIVTLHSDFIFEDLVNLDKIGADALDAAIVPSHGQGKDMVVGDLQNYISIVLAAGVPVIIPTQKDIRPSEVPIVADTGAKGLLLTPVVTGTTAQHIEKNVREFRVAADDLGDETK